MTIKEPDAGPPSAEPETGPGTGTSAAAVAVAGGEIGRPPWDDAWRDLRRRWVFWGRWRSSRSWR